MEPPRIIKPGELPTEASYQLPSVDEQLRSSQLIVSLQLAKLSEVARRGVWFDKDQLVLFKELNNMLIDLKKIAGSLTSEAVEAMTVEELEGLHREVGRLLEAKRNAS